MGCFVVIVVVFVAGVVVLILANSGSSKKSKMKCISKGSEAWFPARWVVDICTL